MTEELVEVHLVLTKSQAALLTHAACELYHHLKTTHSSDTYGALIQNETVLDAREVWRKVEAETHVGEWTNPVV